MNIAKEIPNNFITVENPDHPFTYDGPDRLLSSKDGLIAIFEIRENEKNNSNKLFSRVTNSIIAYPSFTKMILLLDSKNEPSNSILKFGKYYFKEFLELKDLKKSNLLIQDKESDYKLKNIKHIQKRIFSMQSKVQDDNVKYIEKNNFEIKNFSMDNSFKEKAKYFDRLSHRSVTTRANIYEFQEQYFAIKKLSKSTSDLKELKPYYEFAINSEFDIDNGVPHFNYIKKKVLNLSEIPISRFDPFKPIRVASLFGWYISNSDSRYQLEERISKFKK